MVLAFSRTDHKGELTLFKERIQAGIMDHSFRLGNRWELGQRIHFWDNSPKDHTNTPKQFMLYPRTFVQAIEEFEMVFLDEGDEVKFSLIIGSRKIEEKTELEEVAIRSGFTNRISFFNWYNRSRIKSNVSKYSGQLIHWSKPAKVYDESTAQKIKS